MSRPELVPSLTILSSPDVRVVERKDSAIHFEVFTPAGFVADLFRFKNRLIFEQAHVEGVGLTIGVIRRVAKLFGEAENVEDVIIQGGSRTSGAHRGTTPTLIRLKVNP